MPGNLTRDPEVKHIPASGNTIANFGMAMNERWTDPRSGEQRESVCFVEIEAWNRQAELIGKYLCKGSPVLIEGSLKFEQWEDDAGVSRHRLRVRLQRFEFMGSPGENTEQVENAEPADNTQQSDNAEQMPQVNESAAAVPF